MKVGLEKMDTQAWAEAVTQFDQVLEKNPNQATALNAKGVVSVFGNPWSPDL